MYFKTSILILISQALSVKAQIGQLRWGTNTNLFDGLTVTWSNTGNSDSIQWGYTNQLDKGVFAGIKRPGYSTSAFFHYSFSSVPPDTTIYFRFWNSQTNKWESLRTFATAPDPAKNKFTFAALGDCRTDPNVLTNISNSVTAHHPALALFNGDLTASGTSASEYNTFFSASANFLSQCVVLHAEGNHDAGNSSIFSNLWNLPQTNGTNLYYSVRYGNALFITLNSCDFNGTMLTWLHNTLVAAESDTSIVWKIASFHHPFFTIGAHQGDVNLYKSTIWKEFDDHGVDIIFNGHDHNYQRSKPINLKISSSSPVAKYGNRPGEGRLQIISGGAGASLYSKGSTVDAWAISIFNSSYNYVMCDINSKIATITAYNSSNTKIDNVILDKSQLANSSEIQKLFVEPIQIFPNPVKNQFTLVYNYPEIGFVKFTLTDEKGKIISEEKLHKKEPVLEYNHDVSGYKKGIYNIMISSESREDHNILIVQ